MPSKRKERLNQRGSQEMSSATFQIYSAFHKTPKMHRALVIK